MPCSIIEYFWHFHRTCCLLLQGDWILSECQHPLEPSSVDLTSGAPSSCEMSDPTIIHGVNTQKTITWVTLPQNPENMYHLIMFDRNQSHFSVSQHCSEREMLGIPFFMTQFSWTYLHNICSVKTIDAIDPEDAFLTTYPAFFVCPAVTHIPDNVHKTIN